ncbi:MAG: glycosyltransferase family 39 protein [Caldilineaceae bacterium]|nr:glycosyltransferase family 39 protein [Caldilineaceae bacterium]
MRDSDSMAEARGVQPTWVRLALLALILVAMGRVFWELGAKNLWWDESLSLQRAESPWAGLLAGRLILYDGQGGTLTTHDQHPFFFFVLQGLLVRLAGNSEFVLRMVSAMAATLLVPAVWVWGRLMARRGVFADGAALWAALLASLHPFFLWYGQEARPYALWALLALVSTYCLLRATEEGRRWWAGYALALALFLTSHYYAVFLLPVHGLVVAAWLWGRSRRWALAAMGAALAMGAAVSSFAYWAIVTRDRGGANFDKVTWGILFPDLLNAFSLGLSVDITQVWLLDLLFGAVALAGALWSVRSRRTLAAGGWVAPALVVGPVAVLLVAMRIFPAYMNARHMSLIGGGMILLAGAGLALLGRGRRWAAALVALAMVAGMGYSTFRYFTVEEYEKDDFAGVGRYLDGRIAAGDLLLLKSPFAWRVFEYYLPLDTVDAARAAGAPLARYGVPLLRGDWPDQEAQMAQWAGQARRIWYVRSNTHPYADLEGRVETWLEQHLFRVQELSFFSHSSLQASLFLPEVPVYEDVTPQIDAAFGDLILLADAQVGTPYTDDLALPVTLYWQAAQAIPDHYKYVLKLVEVVDSAPVADISITEREPYDGAIPTIYWGPGQTIVEYTELPPAHWPKTGADAARYRIALQVYRADTLEKLPVTRAGGGASVAPDGQTLLLPYAPGGGGR